HTTLFRSPMSLFPNADLGNDPEVIGADIPAGGKTSARAIAKMYAALLAEVDGLRLISPEGLQHAATLAVEGKDEVFGNQVRWPLGYALGGPSVEEHSETTFGMGGVGGSWAGADTATGTSLAVTKNLLTENFDTAARIARMVFVWDQAVNHCSTNGGPEFHAAGSAPAHRHRTETPITPL